MPLYYVNFAFEHTDPLPPVSELVCVEADNPKSAVEAMLRAGRVPQVPGLRWARVVVAVHGNGVPSQVMRFPIHAEQGQAIDWELPGTEAMLHGAACSECERTSPATFGWLFVGGPA